MTSAALQTTLKPEVIALAASLKPQMKLEGDSITVPADLYATTLPEGIDLATVKRLHDHRNNFLAGAALAAGEVAIEAMKDDPNLKTVTTKIAGMGKDDATITTQRQHEHRASPTSSELVKAPGWTTVAYRANPGTGVKAVRDHLKGIAAGCFG